MYYHSLEGGETMGGKTRNVRTTTRINGRLRGVLERGFNDSFSDVMLVRVEGMERAGVKALTCGDHIFVAGAEWGEVLRGGGDCSFMK